MWPFSRRHSTTSSVEDAPPGWSEWSEATSGGFDPRTLPPHTLLDVLYAGEAGHQTLPVEQVEWSNRLREVGIWRIHVPANSR